jgi:hypothetical protein
MKKVLGRGILFLLLSVIPAAVVYFNYDAIGFWWRTKMLTADGFPSRLTLFRRWKRMRAPIPILSLSGTLCRDKAAFIRRSSKLSETEL